jgi:uncharacterized membrane protein YhaH (DUF805 family)
LTQIRARSYLALPVGNKSAPSGSDSAAFGSSPMDVKSLVAVFRRVVTANYFDFHGRACRTEFWSYISVILAVTATAETLVQLLSIAAIRMLFTAWSIGCFLPTVAVAIRRLHDLDRSGWLLVTPIVPAFLMLLLFFWLWPVTVLLATTMFGITAYLLFLCMQPGMRGDNRYGPDPAQLRG